VDSWQIADLLKQNNIAVVLNQEHSLPTAEDDDVDQPYKHRPCCQKAGVMFALNDDDEIPRQRNLPFMPVLPIAYGLDKEEALKATTVECSKNIRYR